MPCNGRHWRTYLWLLDYIRAAKMLKNGTLKTYKSFPHGMPTTGAPTINADLLAFLKGSTLSAIGRGVEQAGRLLPASHTLDSRPTVRPATRRSRNLINPENGNLGGGDFRRPQDFGKTRRDSDALRATCHIGDYVASDGVADFLAP
jgi:hypothetical protein